MKSQGKGKATEDLKECIDIVALIQDTASM